MAKDRARALEVVEPVVAASGFDLDDLTIRRVGKRTMVVVVVDADTVDSDGLSEVSRAVGAALDAADVPAGPYTLEVTSRGVSRPLTLPRHWRRNSGRTVAVTLADGTVARGPISDVDDAGAVVGGARIEFADVTSAVVQVDFGGGA